MESKVLNMVCLRQMRNILYCKSIRKFSDLPYDKSGKFEFKLIDTVENNILRGKYRATTHPGFLKLRTVHFPKEVSQTILNMIKEDGYHDKDLKSDCQNLLGILKAKQLLCEDDQVKVTLDTVTEKLISQGTLSQEFAPKNLNIEDMNTRDKKTLKNIMKRNIFNWKPVTYNKYKSFIYLCARGSSDYASLISVFKEIKQRKRNFEPKSLFDFGSGVGTATWAVDTIWPESCLEVCNVDSSADMNELNERIQEQSYGHIEHLNKRIKERTYFRQHIPVVHFIKYDIVVAARALVEVGSLNMRTSVVDMLWRKVAPGGFLVLLEAGTPWGHAATLDARDFILNGPSDKSKDDSNKEGYVFAPCPHHHICPNSRRRPGDRNKCFFSVKYMESEIAVQRSRETFSYMVFHKAPMPQSANWPRVLEPVIRKSRHTHVRLCTVGGALREIIATKNRLLPAAYDVCSKAKWGDRLPIVFEKDTLGQERPITQNTSDFMEDFVQTEEEKDGEETEIRIGNFPIVLPK